MSALGRKQTFSLRPHVRLTGWKGFSLNSLGHEGWRKHRLGIGLRVRAGGDLRVGDGLFGCDLLGIAAVWNDADCRGCRGILRYLVGLEQDRIAGQGAAASRVRTASARAVASFRAPRAGRRRRSRRAARRHAGGQARDRGRAGPRGRSRSHRIRIPASSGCSSRTTRQERCRRGSRGTFIRHAARLTRMPRRNFTRRLQPSAVRFASYS